MLRALALNTVQIPSRATRKEGDDMMRNGIINWLLALGLTVVCCAAEAEVRLQGAGSTFVAPMMQRWTTEYQKAHPDVRIDYQSIGSGGGIKGITEKTLEFGASDAPMSKS